LTACGNAAYRLAPNACQARQTPGLLRGRGLPRTHPGIDQHKGYARVVNIARSLEISQASVTNMIQRLDAEDC
jgi:hypothetical protein